MNPRIKKVISAVFFFCVATVLPLCLWNGLQGVDNLYMYAHAKDMLLHGFSRATDIFSLHDNFVFSYQKWATCLLTYFFVSNFGWYGLRIATYALIFILLASMYAIGLKFNKQNRLINVILVMICAFLLEANGTLRFRPHVFAGIIFVCMIYQLERYSRSEIKADGKFYIEFFTASILIMWFHSTMWIMFVVPFLPYIFNFNFFEARQYAIRPLLQTIILMFAAGIFNPNGLNQYTYMLSCLSATGSKYAYVDELQPIPFAAYIPLFVFGFMILSFMIYVFYKYHDVFYLPSVYFILGSLAIPLFAWRMVFYAVIFITAAGMIQVSRLKNANDIFEPFVIPLMLIMMTGIICFVGFFTHYQYKSVSDKALLCGTKDIEINNAIDMIYTRSGNGTRIFNTTAHVGSYCIYKGLKPYMDCRAEVYDININKQKDVLSEIQSFSDDKYHGMKLSDGGINAVEADYHPDYYVLTSYSDADMNIRSALDNKHDAYCLYSGTHVWIYSFSDSKSF